MKKLIYTLVLISILIFSATVVNAQDITVYVNGSEVYFESQPEITNERTMVPMRAIFEKLDAEVSWDGNTKTVTAIKGDTTVVTTIGNNVMTVNGEPKEMDIAPYISNDLTYVPVRFVSEALHCSVAWDGENSRVTIIEYPTGNYIELYNTACKFVKEYGKLNEQTGQYEIKEVVERVMLELIYDEERGFVFIKVGFEEQGAYCDTYLQLWQDGYRETMARLIYEGKTAEVKRVYMGDEIYAELDAGGLNETTFLKVGDAMFGVLDGVLLTINENYSLKDAGIIY